MKILTTEVRQDMTVWKVSALVLMTAGLFTAIFSDAPAAGRAVCAFAYAAAALCVLRPVSENGGRIIQRALFALSPVASYFILETMTGVAVPRAAVNLFSEKGAANIFIIVIALWFFYVIFNKIKSAAVCLMCAAYVIGLVNYILIAFRDSPLLFTDIASVGTAMDVAGNYSLKFSAGAAYCTAFALIYIAILSSMHGYRSIDRPRRFACCGLLIGGMILLAGAVTGDTAAARAEISGIDITGSFRENGTALSLALSVRDSTVEKPAGYSPAAAAKIAERYKSDKAAGAGAVSEKHPNIIVVMDESYADLSVLGKFDCAEDYAPFYRSLRDNTIKGTLHSSVFGGNTANTEYEFLTGNSLAFMPLHSVPFNYRIRSDSPSFARTLAAQGYGGGIAFHPGRESSYHRDEVYPYLGFDRTMFLSDVKDPEMLRSYMSDDCDFRTVISEYEKYRNRGGSAPFFLYNVTIQNHSDYKKSSGCVEGAQYLSGGLADCELTGQYLKLVKKTDDALKDLITYYEKTDEPTVIVFFGDHQPCVDAGFYRDVFGGDTDDLNTLEKKYRVPFMIWANYDIDEKSDVQISANYLGPYLLNSIGAGMTGYDKYLLDLYKKVPVITSVCYIGDNGKIYARDAESKYSGYLHDYQMLQYNNSIDTENRVDDFFTLRE